MTDEPIGASRTLHASTRKWLMVSAIGGVFVAIGIFMIINKGDFLAWFVTLFFGLVAAVGLLQLFGYGAKLELGSDTFTQTNFGRTSTERWQDSKDFAVWRSGGNEMIAYDRVRDVGTHMAEMNRMLSGRTASLPDTYGMKGQDLANLMNAYQAAAVERSWQGHAEVVGRFRDMIADGLKDAGTPAEIITDSAAMNLPDDMPSWPSILVVAKEPRPDGSRHVLICADVLSPISCWVPEAEKQQQAFDLLAADELQIIDSETNDVRRIVRESQKSLHRVAMKDLCDR